MEQPVAQISNDLDTFLDFIYGGLEGYIYMAASAPKGSEEDWEQRFFKWPEQRNKIAPVLANASKTHEIYMCPSVFETPKNGQRENFKCAQVVWADFDGNAPELSTYSAAPSLVVQSSEENNQHVYWKLTEPITASDALEDINQRIYASYQADSSWDAVRLLRPPTTLHHESGNTVSIVHREEIAYELEAFHVLAPPPKKEEPAFQLGTLPTLETVLLQYAIPIDLQGLLGKSKSEVTDRSASLMNAAYSCCQSGMKDVEVFVVLQALATKWGKFEGRKDKEKQLSNIVTRARQKYPDILPEPEPEEETEEAYNPFFIWTYDTLLTAEVEFDWVVEGMLMERGNMLMAGPGGIGKSQIMMDAMKHIACGKDWLHYKIKRPYKIGYLSLEMGIVENQIFMRSQDKNFTDEDRVLINQNLDTLTIGESLPLNVKAGQDILLQLIEERGWEGVFIDSVGSAILGNINNAETVQPFTNFNDKIRNRLGCFLWYIHHTRKSGPGQSGPTSQDDVYGDQYLVNRCTSAYGVLHAKDGLIRVRNFKNRLAAREDDYLIERTKNLGFLEVNSNTATESLNLIDNSGSIEKLNGANGIEL